MGIVLHLLWLVLGCIVLAPAAYGAAYIALRACGTLGVSGGGWQAAGIAFGDSIVVTALGLFGVFALPMRWESGVRRWLARGPGQDDLISDVVVDVIPIG
jgi:hypothetical protein